MTISSSLNSGVMGLAVNSARLGTIADNIANSDTFGYKRSVTEFQSLVAKNSVNVFSSGGVRVEIGRDVDAQAGIITTGSATDIAVSGRGLLPVTDTPVDSQFGGQADLLLTATGSFSQDRDGFLRTTSGLTLLGWPADETGSIGAVTRQGGASLEPVRIQTSQFDSSATENINLGINLPADDTNAGAPGTPYDLSIEYFDNFGRVQLMTASFTPDTTGPGASNAWNVELFDNSSGTPVSVSTFDVSFLDTQTNGGGVDQVTNNATYDAATGEITVNLPSGPVQVFVGQSGSRAGLTQFAAPFAPQNLSKDGASIGTLQGIEIDDAGRIQAVYDTGFRQTLYQVPVADVPNFNGLIAENNQTFRVSQQSGDVFLWDSGTGPVGQTVGFGLMESTTDVASELTALIETQRAYSSNAKIIQTVDELLQETNNIIR